MRLYALELDRIRLLFAYGECEPEKRQPKLHVEELNYGVLSTGYDKSVRTSWLWEFLASEPGQFVIPGDPGFIRGLHRLDSAFGQGQLVLRDTFTGMFWHPPIMASAGILSTLKPTQESKLQALPDIP